jgi:DNA (cytosine-5)-methyltransferase 1
VRVVGLFSGIGGLERGLENAGFETAVLSEIDESCRAVLSKRFPDAPLLGDIMGLDSLPSAGIWAAGFPCQPFSQAGLMNGLSASHTLLARMMNLLEQKKHRPRYVLLENVKNIVHLESGGALRYITKRFEDLGYSWAYRIVDTSAFGLPQRRKRWIFVASLNDDAEAIVLAVDACKSTVKAPIAHGFYWTEGNSGLGWADDSVPPLKSGSGLGIPSPPAIWVRRRNTIVTPSIRDAELLQGFPVDWTDVGDDTRRFERLRWKMVGNAVSVPVAEWIGHRIAHPPDVEPPEGKPFLKAGPWPQAAWGRRGTRRAVCVGAFPVAIPMTPIMEFLRHETAPLSSRATRGFRIRLERSCLRYPPEFLDALHHHEMVVG